MPGWHVEKIEGEYDLSINIESFQEMDQSYVTSYINLFDKLTKDGGYVYISNSREYKFRGEWDFPQYWELLFKHRTPRAWTNNHPTEIFRKTKDTHTAARLIQEHYFEQELNLQEEVAALISKCTTLKSALRRKKRTLNKKKSTITKLARQFKASSTILHAIAAKLHAKR